MHHTVTLAALPGTVALAPCDPRGRAVDSPPLRGQWTTSPGAHVDDVIALVRTCFSAAVDPECQDMEDRSDDLLDDHESCHLVGLRMTSKRYVALES